MIFLGIDPGKSGGIAAINDNNIELFKLTNAEEQEIAGFIRDWSDCRAVIERVHSSPQMGVVSAFSFGRSYGFLRGCLAALQIPFVDVSPQRWQRSMDCLTGGDKNISKSKAQELYPDLRITHATADALLLATYCKSKEYHA